jgi:hypothetical protein
LESLLCALLLTSAASAEVKIVGDTKYKSHSLVRLRAEGVDAKAALLWRTHPSKDVQKATAPRGVFEFAAHPGAYEVELLVISQSADGLKVEESRVTVEIESCSPTPPKPDPKPPGGDGKLDPVAALGRIRFGSAGCTATVIGPRRSDGRWDVLTAAHCVNGVGQRGTMSLKDGRSLGIKVVARQSGPDVAWCVTEDVVDALPYALVAEANPLPGTPIWHMGYGVDKPGNREDGTVTGGENSNGQLRMSLSVSSGDSGGGIFRTDTNEVISTVCCTSGVGRQVAMYGASTEAIRRTRPTNVTVDEEWTPIQIPLVEEAVAPLVGWTPTPLPSRIVGQEG